MKIKNVKLSLIVFASLVMLSFAFFVGAQSSSNQNVFLDSDQDGLSDEEEKSYGTDSHNRDTDGDGYSDGTEIQAGYDPTKPAPGDKLVQETSNSVTPEKEDNLTKQLAYKLSNLAKESATTSESSEEESELTLDNIENIVDESLNNSGSFNDTLPEINMESIKIKKQDYSNLSKEKAQAKMKEDAANYLSAIFYIISTNSPSPITSSKDMESSMSSFTQQIIGALSTRNAASLENIETSGQKMLEQIQEIEVPEDFVDIHIKAIRFAQYSQNFKKIFNPEISAEDPVADIANLSKLEGFLGEMSSFMNEVGQKLSEYALDFNADLKDKIEDYGIKLTDDSSQDTTDSK